MIVAPNWESLDGLSAGLDAHDPIERKQAVERVLQLILDELPDVQAVCLYHLDGETAILRAATDQAEGAARPRADFADTPTWDADAQRWVAPLRAAGDVWGMLEILVEDLDEAWLTWCSVLADLVAKGLALGTQASPDEPAPQPDAPRFVTASRMLLSAESHEEVATAAMYVAGDQTQGVMLTLFEQPISRDDEEDTTNQRFVGAIATPGASEQITPEASLGRLPAPPYMAKLRQQVPISVTNIQTDAGYLSAWMRDRMSEMGVQQVTAFGLVSDGRIVGTLDLLAAEPYTLTQEELDLYSGFANQIGTVILSKRLLQHSLESQKFASRLVKTNKAIAEAETYQDIAQAVLNDAPDDIDAVAIALFNRPFTLMGSPSSLHTQAIVTREHALDGDWVDTFSAVEDARVTYFLHEYLEGQMMMLWNIDRPRRPVLAETLVEQLQQEDVDVITSFGLNMGGSLRGILVFAGTNELRDPGTRYDGLRAIADQLAAVIENRLLLQQTTEALDLIQSQYETSSRVFRSGNLAEILKAVFDFANGAFTHAHLVTTDIDGVKRIVAEVTPEGYQSVLRQIDLSTYPASQTLKMLEALEIRNVAEDAFIDADERTALQAQNIGALVILPVLSGDDLSGLMMLTNPEPVRVPPDRLRAMRSLADQVGVVLENRKLLHSTEANLEEIQTLYETNQALLSTNSVLDIMRVLQNHLAPDAAAIYQVTVTYNPQDRNQVIRLGLAYELTYTAEQSLQETLTTERDTLDPVYHYLRRLDRNVIFAPHGTPVPGNPVELLQERYEIESYAAVIVRERGQVTSLILLLYDEPKPFLGSTRRLYRAIADQVGITMENQKLLRESQQSARELAAQVRTFQAIGDLAMHINMVQDERELLDTGAQMLKETVNVDHCGIVLFNEDDQTGVLVSEYPQTEVQGTTVSTANNPILSPDFDLSNVAILDDRSDFFADARNHARKVMLVPLVGANGELIGSVGLDIMSDERVLTDQEVRTAQTIAAQLAVGLQNVRLLADAQQRAGQLQHIANFSQTAQTSLNLSQMIDAALESVPRLIAVRHMSVALYDEVREALVIAGGWFEEDGTRYPLEGESVVPRSGTVIGHVYETGSYLYVPNIRTDKRLSYAYAANEATRSLLAMPLTNRGRILGVMTVGSNQADAYTDTDIALFQQLVNQMAVAIDNARTYTQSQRVAQNKTLANEISVQLQRQNDITKMIDLTMKEVGRAIGAKRGRIRLSRLDDNETGA